MRIEIHTIGCFEDATSNFVIRRTDGCDVGRLDAVLAYYRSSSRGDSTTCDYVRFTHLRNGAVIAVEKFTDCLGQPPFVKQLLAESEKP